MTAQNAIDEARYVSRSLKKLISNKNATLDLYQTKSASFIIPLGGKYALLETSRFRASGLWVWALKYLVLLRYLYSILPWRRALVLTWRELVLFTKND